MPTNRSYDTALSHEDWLTVRPLELAPTQQTIVMGTPASSINISTSDNTDLIYQFDKVVSQPTGSSISIQPVPYNHFYPSGARPDDYGMARQIWSSWNTFQPGAKGAQQMVDLFTSLYGADVWKYRKVLDDLNTKVSHSFSASQVGAATSFISGLQSCPGFSNDDSMLREGDCVWTRTPATYSRSAGSGDHPGYSNHATELQVGGQKQFAEDWFIGAAAAYTQNRMTSASGQQQSNGSGGMLGVTLKHQRGDWLFQASLGGGYDWQTSSRRLYLNSGTYYGTSRPSVGFLNGRLRAAYQYVREDWYLRPYLNLDLTGLRQAAYSESGMGVFNLSYKTAAQAYLTATPGIEIGVRYNLPNAYQMRLFTDLGMALGASNSWSVDYRMEGQGTGGLPWERLSVPVPDAVGRATIGMNIWQKQGIELGLQTTGEWGNRYTSVSGVARVDYKF